ncbi:MAG: hypothetical protein HYV16_07100 [Gammaproteobacteria bacterium]|nr:hypothetical protein [Gammaproteobacteria bacterium]
MNKTLAAGLVMLSSSALYSGVVAADDNLPTDLASYVPSLRDAVLKGESFSSEQPSFGADLGLGNRFFVQTNFSTLDRLDVQRNPHFVDSFSLEIEKYSMGFGIRRPLIAGLNFSASFDLVHLDYADQYASVLKLDNDTGKSIGLGLSTSPSNQLELGAQWSVTRYDSDPLQRDFNAVDFKATYKFTENFGLFTQYGVSDDVDGDGQLEDQYKVGGRISF